MEEHDRRDLESIFAQVEDPRMERTKLHRLRDIIMLAICGGICGAQGWVDIEEFGKAKEAFFREWLELANGIPSHDRFGRVFALIDPHQFEASFVQWVQGISETVKGVVAIDGKTLRRSHDRTAGKKALHLVSAWAVENRLVLAQVATEEKSNEITAIPLLLEQLALSGCLVTIDAMGTQRANQLKRAVPMKRIAWDTVEAGHFEVELVYHCGESTLGEHVHTLPLIDVATDWSERVTVLGRGQQAMEQAFRHVLSRLPFAVKELHPDNGPEFFNAHLVRFWKEKVVGVHLSRSRPYHKNDNRFVEQKSDNLVRQYFGTLRLETQEQWQQMNDIYALMWLYYNLFQPVLYLIEKTVVVGKTYRKWDQAQTPYARLKASGALSLEQQQRLDILYEQTNPRQLRETIYERLAHLWQSCEKPTEQAA